MASLWDSSGRENLRYSPRDPVVRGAAEEPDTSRGPVLFKSVSQRMDFNTSPSTENSLKATAFIEHIPNTTATTENTFKTAEVADSILKTIVSTKSVPVTTGAIKNGPNLTGKIYDITV